MEKMERESEQKVSSDLASKLAANSCNSLTGGSSSECQRVARVNLGPHAILLRTHCQAAPAALQKFLDEV